MDELRNKMMEAVEQFKAKMEAEKRLKSDSKA